MKAPVKISLFLLVVIVLAGAAAGIYLYTKPQKDLLRSRPDFILTAEELHKAFETDEKVASERFLNKVIELSGTIADTDINEGKTISITLATQNEMSSVICNLHKAINSDELNKGESITLRGELSGFLMDVLLNNCVIIDSPGRD